MKKVVEIITAYYRLLILKLFGGITVEEKLEQQRRLKICETCLLRSKNWCDSKKTIVMIDEEKSKNNIRHLKNVTGCGCYLPAKALVESKEECPLNKW
ncbi:hypothetical protein M2T79_09360 [Elizabethkingia miricola]|uniref:hypothetical protein n=1 Tax=Elizabethkingia miricola TaxID=172045 RepID=UPI002019D661|nr:hypothetical protein [Elizabethkingia miricola]MCL1656806.1 hypothetical protein [Elizabethkingia miricola]